MFILLLENNILIEGSQNSWLINASDLHVSVTTSVLLSTYIKIYFFLPKMLM